MKLSEKRRQEVFDAIEEHVMNKRIAIADNRSLLGKKNVEHLDELLYGLSIEIHKSVLKALNVKGL